MPNADLQDAMTNATAALQELRELRAEMRTLQGRVTALQQQVNESDSPVDARRVFAARNA